VISDATTLLDIAEADELRHRLFSVAKCIE